MNDFEFFNTNNIVVADWNDCNIRLPLWKLIFYESVSLRKQDHFVKSPKIVI